MKKIFLGIVTAIIIFASVTVIAVAANYATHPVEKDSKNMHEKVRIVPQEVIDEKYDTSKYIVCTPSGSRDDSLDKKLENFEKQEAERDVMDMDAYAVVNKYNNKKIYAKQSIISDKKSDCEIMKKMIDLIESKKVTDEEANLLRSYLERRLTWLDESDRDLAHNIEKVLK